MNDKPSRNEEEYFARRDAELIKAGREAIAAESKRRERASHYMKCPKCGGDLVTEEYHTIQIDRCPDCDGMWLDAGEVDLLVAGEDHGVGGLLKAIVRGVRGAAPAKPSE